LKKSHTASSQKTGLTKVLSQHLPVRTGQNQEKPDTIAGALLKFDKRKFWILLHQPAAQLKDTA
jgi:hypothetical protein